MVKYPPASAEDSRDMGSIPWLERSPRRKWTPTPVFLPVQVHGQKSLVGYSLWWRKQSDVTEYTHTHTHTHTHTQRIVSIAQEQVSEHIISETSACLIFTNDKMVKINCMVISKNKTYRKGRIWSAICNLLLCFP